MFQQAYFFLGFNHILDWQGYDHMLFLLVLLAGVTFGKWPSILALITAFTLGHSITLALTVLHTPILDPDLVEFLIPITIVIAAVINVVRKHHDIYMNVIVTLLFGLIHGMGFAGYLGALLPPNSSLWKELLAFNIGVEAGQLVFASGVILVFYVAQGISKMAVLNAQKVISIVAGIVSVFLAASKWSLL